MQKNIVLFSLIVTIIIVLNCNLVYSEQIEDNIDENIKKENIGPYPTLDDLKKELKEERHNVDQQRLDEIRKKEEEKKALESEEDKENNEQIKDESDNKNKKAENELIPKFIVRLRGQHSNKYLCSYNFTIVNENTSSELTNVKYDDYKVLLKKPSLKVRPGEMINFEFSEPPKKIRAFIWNDEITELNMTRGSIKVPDYDKKLVVGIEGTYKNGKILYAVVLDIRG